MFVRRLFDKLEIYAPFPLGKGCDFINTLWNVHRGFYVRA